MRLIIKARNIEITKEIEKFVESRLGSLQKFVDVLRKEEAIGKALAEFFVELERITLHHKKGPFFRVKTRLVLPRKILIAQSNSDGLKNAIVKVKDEMQQEIKKYKFQKTGLDRRKQRKKTDEVPE